MSQYNGVCSSWLWECEQHDIKLLQELYKSLGYHVTLSQAYDLWYKYSEYCYANWLIVDQNTDLSGSLMFLKDVGIYINKFEED